MTSTITGSIISLTTGAVVTSFALIIAALLVMSLIKKELLTHLHQPHAVTLRRALNIALVPLLLGFGMIAAASVWDLIG